MLTMEGTVKTGASLRDRGLQTPAFIGMSVELATCELCEKVSATTTKQVLFLVAEYLQWLCQQVPQLCELAIAFGYLGSR